MMFSLGYTGSGKFRNMQSANPARLLGLEKTYGSLDVGKARRSGRLSTMKGNLKFVLISRHDGFR
jgi:N-acetylglucosamine-6-phosphate deacetylase